MESRTLDYRRKTLHDYYDVWDRLDELQETVVSLRQRQEQQTGEWQSVSAEQRQHCADLAAMYQQLQELLLFTNMHDSNNNNNNNNNNLHGVMKERPQCSSTEEKILEEMSLRGEISDLLQNFKQHIEKHTHETKARLDTMQQCMEEMENKLEEEKEKNRHQEERLIQLEEQHKEILQRVSSVASIEDLDRLRVSMMHKLQSQNEEVLDSIQQHDRSLSEKLTVHDVHSHEVYKKIQKEINHSIDKTVQKLQAKIDTLSSEVKEEVLSMNKKIGNVKEETKYQTEEMMKEQLSKTCKQVQGIHQELSVKHLQLVEDTMNAVEKIAHLSDSLPKKLSLLQDDVSGIHATLYRHGEVLNEHCLQGSLQGAFDEVKDWLQDLERRALNRGELDEILAGVDYKLAALKRDFILNSPVKHYTDESIDGESDSPVATTAATTTTTNATITVSGGAGGGQELKD